MISNRFDVLVLKTARIKSEKLSAREESKREMRIEGKLRINKKCKMIFESLHNSIQFQFRYLREKHFE